MTLTLAWVRFRCIHALTSVKRVLLRTQIVVGLWREITVCGRTALMRVSAIFRRPKICRVEFSEKLIVLVESFELGSGALSCLRHH